jgi:hypothetical protein
MIKYAYVCCQGSEAEKQIQSGEAYSTAFMPRYLYDTAEEAKTKDLGNKTWVLCRVRILGEATALGTIPFIVLNIEH